MWFQALRSSPITYLSAFTLLPSACWLNCWCTTRTQFSCWLVAVQLFTLQSHPSFSDWPWLSRARALIISKRSWCKMRSTKQCAALCAGAAALQRVPLACALPMLAAKGKTVWASHWSNEGGCEGFAPHSSSPPWWPCGLNRLSIKRMKKEPKKLGQPAVLSRLSKG